MTSRRGGSQGASVPCPSEATRRNDAANRMKPIAPTISPGPVDAHSTQVTGQSVATFQRRAIQRGMTTATDIGSTRIDRIWRRR